MDGGREGGFWMVEEVGGLPVIQFIVNPQRACVRLQWSFTLVICVCLSVCLCSLYWCHGPLKCLIFSVYAV